LMPVKWRIVGLCVIVAIVFAVQYFFYDTIAMNRVNPHLQMEGITLGQDEATAKKQLRKGKQLPDMGLGQLYYYEHQAMELYYMDGHVTSIKTGNTAHSAYGIHVGSTEAEARETLEKLYFRFVDENVRDDESGTKTIEYGISNDVVSISFEIDEGYVSSITVRYNKPTKKNITA